MRQILHSLLFYVRFNRLRLATCGLLLAGFVAIVLSETNIVARSDGEAYWSKFVELAQIGLAISLAYVALPYFRHNKSMEERSRNLIGASGDERLTFIHGLNERKQGENEERPELLAVAAIVYLLESLACSWRGELIERAPDNLAKRPVGDYHALSQVRHFHKKAGRISTIADDGALNRWLHTYFPGGDLVLVLAGVVLATLVHLLALAEAIVPMKASSVLASTSTQVVIACVLLVWTSLLPAYYAYYSNRVSHTVKDFFVKAEAQKLDFDAHKTDKIEKALDNVPTA